MLTTTFVASFLYTVESSNRGAFEACYGPRGPWAALFSDAPGYLGTELWCSSDEAGTYAVCDRWTTENDYESFLSISRERYEALSLQTRSLYEEETRVGRFECLAAT